MNESHAITLCIKHADPTGFEFLVKKYRREALFHARMLLGNDADSADACQEAFTKAFAAIRRLPFLDNFYPWFYRILRNTCINMLSRRSTVRRYTSAHTYEEQLQRKVETPAFILEQEEEQCRVWETLKKLKSEHREILILKYIQGLSYEDISKILSIPRGTVMSRLYHARRSFKDLYKAIDMMEQKTDKEVKS